MSEQHYHNDEGQVKRKSLLGLRKISLTDKELQDASLVLKKALPLYENRPYKML